ncbi:hypothetical protein EZV62_001978 [Acer yangbiense]|uniref:Late embryogenesis abundant protein LEA-2 subgroup domain-containing protein n=1 Tax=Acer yangbiense TaxID=1000413 RepID=A0A5C7IWE1_9ROSI|nr:hypothetical protein EZV62_001978 [Acer yangbiense]
MADKVYPRESDDEQQVVTTPATTTPIPPPLPEKSLPVSSPSPPSAGTYVIQIPKDQIYRVPPPDNALRYKHLSKPKSRKTRIRRCCCCFFITLFVLLFLLAVSAAVFYFVFRPESPNYTVDNLSVKSFNLTSSTVSPSLDFTLSAHNPNNKIGIYYLKPSSVKLYYKDLNLCNGFLPQFFQPRNNVTVFKTALTASALELTTSVRNELIAAEKSGTVPFRVDVRAPVKLKVGSVKSWSINVKVKCDVTVDKLTAQSKILSKKCDYSVDIW